MNTYYVVTEIFNVRFMYGSYTKERAFWMARFLNGFVYIEVKR
mgnify:CR=1 FL=1